MVSENITKYDLHNSLWETLEEDWVKWSLGFPLKQHETTLCKYKKLLVYKFSYGPRVGSELAIRDLLYRTNAKSLGHPVFNSNVKPRLYLLVEREKYMAALEYRERVEADVSPYLFTQYLACFVSDKFDLSCLSEMMRVRGMIAATSIATVMVSFTGQRMWNMILVPNYRCVDPQPITLSNVRSASNIYHGPIERRCSIRQSCWTCYFQTESTRA